ncbi:MAG TPA: transporter substrate-binding domain-containing protein [Desulfobulbus sp.]|nr:transporter substrate-binding domain-containing protein [Desulfobulbus sp.]
MKTCLLPWLLMLLLAAPASARNYLVLTENLPPVHYEEDGRVVGIATEVVEEIFRRAGLQPDIRVYPWKRAYQIALRTRDSFIFTINRTPEREKLFKWIGPILQKRTCLFKLRSRRDIRVRTLADVKKYTTAVILGYALTDRLLAEGFAEHRELIVTHNKKSQIRVFLSGHADLITGNEYTLAWALRDEGYSMDAVEPVLVMTEKGYYLAANPSVDDQTVQQLQKAADAVWRNGVIPGIINKYMGF